jgi:hypothetical protein
MDCEDILLATAIRIDIDARRRGPRGNALAESIA